MDTDTALITGVSHVTLLVRDLERSARLFTGALGAREVYASGETPFSLARERFLLLGPLWLVLMEGEPVARTYNHVALAVAEAVLPDVEARLRALGADIRPSRPRHPEEGASLYFYDYDGHLFELHSGTLDARLRFYGRFVVGDAGLAELLRTSSPTPGGAEVKP